MAAGRKPGIITAGTWCVDYNMMLEHWPAEESVNAVLSFDQHGGGSGCNFALDMRKLDPSTPVETMSVVGDDDAGRFLLKLADDHGVGRSNMVTVSGVMTQATNCYFARDTGRRTHIFIEGSAKVLSPDHFDFGKVNGDFVHVGLPGVHEIMDAPYGGDANGWVTVLKKARAAGLTTNLELASFPAPIIYKLIRPCLPYLDYLVVNDAEIGAIAGWKTVDGTVTDVAAVKKAAKEVLSLGSMRAVVTHFPMGSVGVSHHGEEVMVPSVNVPPKEIVGANGAGDAFAAGFICGVRLGKNLSDSIRLAHASSAASLRSASTTGSVESWQACLALADRWGWRS